MAVESLNLVDHLPNAPNVPDWVIYLVFFIIILLVGKILYGWVKTVVFDDEEL